uniref:Bm14223 n=1 Tax=Brugia malayi TaxID=6279 RepID=A0A1I9G0G4_BRUMA|nr:Bm14223 [Brugia malayi]
MKLYFLTNLSLRSTQQRYLAREALLEIYLECLLKKNSEITS